MPFSAYLDVLRKCLQQKRIDTAEQAADEKRAARMPDPEPSDDEEDSNDDGPSASESDDSDHDDDDAAAVIAPPPDALPHAPAALPLPPAPALAAPDAMPLPPAPALVAPIAPPIAPVPAPVPERAAKRPRVAEPSLLDRLTPEAVAGFADRLEPTRWAKHATPAWAMLNELLGTTFKNMHWFPKEVRARFVELMTANGFEKHGTDATPQTFKLPGKFQHMKLKTQADRPFPTVVLVGVWLGFVFWW